MYYSTSDNGVETYPIEVNSGDGIITDPIIETHPEAEVYPIIENYEDNILITPKNTPKTFAETYPIITGVIGIAIISYYVIKWGVAIVAAAPTGGASLGLALVTP